MSLSHNMILSIDDRNNLYNIQSVLDLSIFAVLSIILSLQLFVRHGSVRFHYYILLLGNILEVITNGILVANGYGALLSSNAIVVCIFFDYFASICLWLTGMLALRQFTVTYLGGATALVTTMCSIAVIASLVFIIIDGILSGDNIRISSSNVFQLYNVISWGYFALVVWTLLMLLVVRATYRNKVSNNENKAAIIKIFILIALYTVMLFIANLHSIIITYIRTDSDDVYFGMYISTIVVAIVFIRFATLLFVIFYNKLSVMAPIAMKEAVMENISEVI
ncbi:hypothetical protein BGW37DRAFT_22255 [Umbelopsis sp. PMI_123]|nr:hypothetical protein BGW37DRAFT_22255 [Umbelopsis sp. PMI_123]